MSPRGLGDCGWWTCEGGSESEPRRVSATPGWAAPGRVVEAEIGVMPLGTTEGAAPGGGRTRSAQDRLTGAAAGDLGETGAEGPEAPVSAALGAVAVEVGPFAGEAGVAAPE